MRQQQPWQYTERNKVIAEQNVEINSNLKIINQKNRDITDSLNYAGKIQKSLLRNFTNYSNLLAGYFILYLPKDIVSGDFYWGHQIGSTKNFKTPSTEEWMKEMWYIHTMEY